VAQVYYIALAYSDTVQSDLDYATLNAAVGVSQYKLFTTVENFRPVINSNVQAGGFLNGELYEHVRYSRKIYSGVITSNELDSTAITFLENFWQAKYRYFLRDTAGVFTGSDYIEILTNGGDFPLAYLDGIEQLPELSYSFTAKRVL